ARADAPMHLRASHDGQTHLRVLGRRRYRLDVELGIERGIGCDIALAAARHQIDAAVHVVGTIFLLARRAPVFSRRALDRVAVRRAVALFARVEAQVAALVHGARVRALVGIDLVAVVALFVFFDLAVTAYHDLSLVCTA